MIIIRHLELGDYHLISRHLQQPMVNQLSTVQVGHTEGISMQCDTLVVFSIHIENAMYHFGSRM